MLSFRNVFLATAVTSFAALTSAAPVLTLPELPKVDTESVTNRLSHLTGRTLNGLVPDVAAVSDVTKKLGLRGLETPVLGNLPQIDTESVIQRLAHLTGRTLNGLVPNVAPVSDVTKGLGLRDLQIPTLPQINANSVTNHLSGVANKLKLRHVGTHTLQGLPELPYLDALDTGNAVPNALSNAPTLPSLPGLRRENLVTPDVTVNGLNLKPDGLVQALPGVKRAPATAQTVLEDFKKELAQVSEQLKNDIAKALGPNPNPQAKVDVSVVTPHLLHLKEIVVKVTVALNAVCKVNVDITIVANLIIALLAEIIIVLKLAVKAIVVAQISACLDVVALVGVEIVALIKVTLSIVATIKITVAASVAADIQALGLAQVFALVTVA
jgi:hypothetical protein